MRHAVLGSLMALLLMCGCGNLPWRVEVGFKNSKSNVLGPRPAPPKSPTTSWIAWETMQADLNRAFGLRGRGDSPPVHLLQKCQQAAAGLKEYYPGQEALFQGVQKAYQALLEKGKHARRNWIRSQLRSINREIQGLKSLTLTAPS
ncbi:MAG: hypothetical protein V3T77_06290 [Planctomycetota bacterium]